jgi:hypothetical protein
MKPKFRVHFESLGWVVQYSYVGILWGMCGVQYYRSQKYAENIRDELRDKGLAPANWYEEKNI